MPYIFNRGTAVLLPPHFKLFPLGATSIKPSIIKILFLFICLSCNDQRTNNNSENDQDRKSSVIIYLANTNLIELSQCSATLAKDTIKFTLSDSASLYTLNILKVQNTILAELRQEFSVTDSSYKKPVFSLITQSIKLDNSMYKIGDRIKGFVNLKFSQFHSWEETRTDTVAVEGLVYAILR